MSDNKGGCNKTRFVSVIGEVSGASKVESEKILDNFLEALSEALKAHGKVSLQNFGTFSALATPARRGNNPKTGEPMEIPASLRISFKASKNLKEELKDSVTH